MQHDALHANSVLALPCTTHIAERRSTPESISEVSNELIKRLRDFSYFKAVVVLTS